MSRKSRLEQVVQPRAITITSFTCDGCGKDISPGDYDGDYAHELVVTLDQDQCVSFYRRRDLCPSCLEPVWLALNQLIGADPDAERDREYED